MQLRCAVTHVHNAFDPKASSHVYHDLTLFPYLIFFGVLGLLAGSPLQNTEFTKFSSVLAPERLNLIFGDWRFGNQFLCPDPPTLVFLKKVQKNPTILGKKQKSKIDGKKRKKKNKETEKNKDWMRNGTTASLVALVV